MTAQKIIVGYDRSSEARAAAAWALDEAALTGASVQFFYAYEWPSWAPAAAGVPSPAVWPDGETERAIDESLHEVVASAAISHPQVQTEISSLQASAALSLVQRSAHAGLVVVGSRGHSAVANLLGSVGVAVSAHAHCPVVVVRGEAAAGGDIVVGVNDSHAAQLALGFAVEQAASRGATLRVLRARPPLTGLWVESPEEVQASLNVLRRSLDELLAPWRDKFPQLTMRSEVVTEHPAAALTRAGSDARLVVVGCRGRGALRGMVLGSVSQHLLHHAACNVAIVHERHEA
ncbi:universal stress protein [Actinoplanes sp. NPDC049681]|uniref:universal stress protein n=1 Tax=Actinoplanes sp. NPDC049681 TaxID=3363905 RepID=UPI00378E9C44